MTYNIGQQLAEGDKWSAGIGYVTIPYDVDRDVFITHCMQTSSLFIKTEDGGYHKDIVTDTEVFQRIEFPQHANQNGTIVIYVQEPVHKELMVIGVINNKNEIIDLVEGQFKINKKFNNNLVEISGSAKDSYLSIAVSGDDTANMLVHVGNSNKNAKLDVEVAGEINISSLNNISLISKESVIFVIQDKLDSTLQSMLKITPTGTELITDNFIINQGQEPITLGNQCKLIFDNFIDLVSQATVTTNIGQQPLLNAQQIANLKQTTVNILSSVSFTK